MTEEDLQDSTIHFYTEDIDFDLPFEEAKIVSWIIEIATKEKKSISSLNFIFCSDQFLHNINVTYLNHDTLTDIITFPYSQGENIESDIFISIPRVKENSQIHASEFNNEMLRVMAHGVLHMCGYKDKSDQESIDMREMEETCIKMFLN